MKTLTTVFLICLLSLGSYAQQGGREKIKVAKIALITERLNLTPDEAQKFWPIYNEYASKQEEIRRSFIEANRKHDPETASDEDNKRMLELGMQAKEKSLRLEKGYSERFLKIINNRQMLNLRKAEIDFKEMLLKRIKGQQQRRLQNRERFNQQQRNN